MKVENSKLDLQNGTEKITCNFKKAQFIVSSFVADTKTLIAVYTTWYWLELDGWG